MRELFLYYELPENYIDSVPSVKRVLYLQQLLESDTDSLIAVWDSLPDKVVYTCRSNIGNNVVDWWCAMIRRRWRRRSVRPVPRTSATSTYGVPLPSVSATATKLPASSSPPRRSAAGGSTINSASHRIFFFTKMYSFDTYVFFLSLREQSYANPLLPPSILYCCHTITNHMHFHL